MRMPQTLSLAALSLAATVALAGTKTHTSVVIDDSIRYASGSLSSARSSSDSLQMIGCEAYASGSALCRARNSSGVLRTCSSTNPAFIETVRMINTTSFVSFWWDTAGQCTNLLVRNGSNYMP